MNAGLANVQAHLLTAGPCLEVSGYRAGQQSRVCVPGICGEFALGETTGVWKRERETGLACPRGPEQGSSAWPCGTLPS